VAGGGGGLGTGAGLGLGTLAAGPAIGGGVIGVSVITFVHLRAGDDLYAPETRSQCIDNRSGQVSNTCVLPGTDTVPLKPTCGDLPYSDYVSINDPEIQRYYTFPNTEVVEAFVQSHHGGDRNIRLDNPAAATEGPCAQGKVRVAGTHYDLRKRSSSQSTFYGTVGVCLCCQDTSAGPQIVSRARLIRELNPPRVTPRRRS